jgi:hypothetical protein
MGTDRDGMGTRKYIPGFLSLRLLIERDGMAVNEEEMSFM